MIQQIFKVCTFMISFSLVNSNVCHANQQIQFKIKQQRIIANIDKKIEWSKKNSFSSIEKVLEYIKRNTVKRAFRLHKQAQRADTASIEKIIRLNNQMGAGISSSIVTAMSTEVIEELRQPNYVNDSVYQEQQRFYDHLTFSKEGGYTLEGYYKDIKRAFLRTNRGPSPILIIGGALIFLMLIVLYFLNPVALVTLLIATVIGFAAIMVADKYAPRYNQGSTSIF